MAATRLGTAVMMINQVACCEDEIGVGSKNAPNVGDALDGAVLMIIK